MLNLFLGSGGGIREDMMGKLSNMAHRYMSVVHAVGGLSFLVFSDKCLG